jgi:hypothetical protein
MRIFPVEPIDGKLTVGDFVERVASTYPILGMAVINENILAKTEDTAHKAIRLSLEKRDLTDTAHLSILITIIQYAKDWERMESSGFWAYICEKLGYKYSERIYAVLRSSVKKACDRYQRVFFTDMSGDNSYYSTVLAHAMAPKKSFYALCDFLVKFYRNNLDCSVYANDPAIDRMLDALRDRCKGATIEQDEDIRGNVVGIQTGFRSLLVQRPVYMRSFLTKLLQKMDKLLSGDELGNKDYTEVLLTQWYIAKLTEPNLPGKVVRHKRTTDIAFTYGKIRLGYILDEYGEPVLRIPSIRLASRENPTVTIFAEDAAIYTQIVGIYGNDYAATSEETLIPLSDFVDDITKNVRIELSIGSERIFESDPDFWSGAILFRDSKAITSKSVDEGCYVLFALRSVSIDFIGEIEHQKRSYFAQLHEFFLRGEASVYVDGVLLCCSKPQIDTLRFQLPMAEAEYVADDVSYQIYARDRLSITVVGQLRTGSVAATTNDGTELSLDLNP